MWSYIWSRNAQAQRAQKEGLNNPEGKFYLIASGKHFTCVMGDEDGNWVTKDDDRTHPVSELSQFLNTQQASDAVHQVGDQFTVTWYDRKTATGRERPTHSPAKEHELPGNEGKSPAACRQRTDFSIFQLGGGQAYRDQIKPKPNQNHSPEKATAEKEMPIFGVMGQGFAFAPKPGQRKLFQVWGDSKNKNGTTSREKHLL